MPKKKYIVDLSNDERETLRQLVRRGKHSSRKVTRACILLWASDGFTNEQIVASLKTAFPPSSAPASGLLKKVTLVSTSGHCWPTMKWLVDEAYPQAARVRVGFVNLNTHRAASLSGGIIV